ncbi:MAG: hypothetical protein K2J60_11800 [Acetatifactor sp.]|nr:hypothetical protein [Acetatifactor sp.]
MKKQLLVLLSAGLLTMILSGCGGTLPDDSSQDESVSMMEQEVSSEPSDAESEIADAEESDNSFPFYGTWKVMDYQSAAISALSADDMESRRGLEITYQSDSVLLDGEKVNDESFTYKTEENTYNYDSLLEEYRANLGEWWNNISEVTCVTIDSNDIFFGSQFFVVDSDTIWIYYEGVFFLAKKI